MAGVPALLPLLLSLPLLHSLPTSASSSVRPSSSPTDHLTFVDTSAWIGAEYTPAAAPANDGWMRWYPSYAASVSRELPLLVRRLSFTGLRVFISPVVWEFDGDALLANMDAFMAQAAANNLRVGWVFFDDCFNGTQMSMDEECVPQKGVHNGCWHTSPAMTERDDVERYRGFVESVVGRFQNDTRVLWWEIFNEPDLSLPFSSALRDAAYGWATALSPLAPVISCWDDSADTQIVDHHEYDTAYASGWAPAVFSNPAKGGLVTEGGSRWYQPPYSSDAGSPLASINFLEAVKAASPSTQYPFRPGAFLSWESFVGNSNTRWHWSSAPNTPEPAIPWDAWLFPDGTPISHTEAAALRRYATGKDEFLSFSKFLPLEVVDGDAYLTVPAGTVWGAPLSAGVTGLGDVLAEASVWLQEGGSLRFIVRAGALPAVVGPYVTRVPPAAGDVAGRRTWKQEAWERRTAAGASSASASAVPPLAPPLLAPSDNCTLGPLLNNTDVCPGGPPGYRDLSVANASDPLAACAAACCAWSECTAWIVREFQGTDENCTNELCCWLKPGCSETSPLQGATAGFVTQPPGPPAPAGIAGYHVVLTSGGPARGDTLSLYRVDDPSGAPGTLLGSFNLSSLENGLVLGAWNMLRVVVEDNAAAAAAAAGDGAGGTSVRVFFNPMFPETGFVGNASDAGRVPLPLPPRIAVVDTTGPPLPPGGLAIAAGAFPARVDYASALPASVF